MLCSKCLPSEMKPVDSYSNNYFPIQKKKKTRVKILDRKQRKRELCETQNTKDMGDMAANKIYFLERQETVTDLNREA